MVEELRITFSTSVAGYNRTEVDAHVSKLLAELEKLEQYSSMALREQNSLRERNGQLEESLKLAKSPGYAQVGAQFEQTLRLAETEAARLVNDAGRDAIRIRDEAKAEAEANRFAAEDQAETLIREAERKAKVIAGAAAKRAIELTEDAEKQLESATKQRADLEKQANVIRSEADNYAASVKAELQAEVEKIQNANARLLKRNADLDAEIARKLDQGERQALEIFRRVEKEATDLRDQAERELQSATVEAASLIENAEETLANARSESDRIFNEANALALNLLVDTRARAEKLAIKSLDLTRDAIAEAEYRLSKLPAQQNSIEEFLRETQRLLTPEQQVMLSRRNSLDISNLPAIEPEVIDADASDSE
jgi:cell division septum initiation protein DivIVA